MFHLIIEDLHSLDTTHSHAVLVEVIDDVGAIMNGMAVALQEYNNRRKHHHIRIDDEAMLKYQFKLIASQRIYCL